MSFGVTAQGFILRPLLFNLYVNDLTDVLPTEVNCHQYANDITIYSHCKPSELQSCQAEMQAALASFLPGHPHVTWLSILKRLK